MAPRTRSQTKELPEERKLMTLSLDALKRKRKGMKQRKIVKTEELTPVQRAWKRIHDEGVTAYQQAIRFVSKSSYGVYRGEQISVEEKDVFDVEGFTLETCNGKPVYVFTIGAQGYQFACTSKEEHEKCDCLTCDATVMYVDTCYDMEECLKIRDEKRDKLYKCVAELKKAQAYSKGFNLYHDGERVWYFGKHGKYSCCSKSIHALNGDFREKCTSECDVECNGMKNGRYYPRNEENTEEWLALREIWFDRSRWN